MKRLFSHARLRCMAALAVTFIVAGCATAPRPLPSLAPARVPDAGAWSRVLERFVDDEGRVDFAGIAADPADLDRYVADVGRVSPTSDRHLFPSPEAVLAYHLNAYNALAMHRIVASGIPHDLGGLRKLQFFWLGKEWVGGVPISLYDYENDVIRPLGDARVHMALNCMVVSCPRLSRQPFGADTLDSQLDSAARTFFAEPRNVVVDTQAGALRLSSILSFYTDDFLAHAPSLAAYVNRYRTPPVPEHLEVRFLPYDGTVNRQPAVR